MKRPRYLWWQLARVASWVFVLAFTALTVLSWSRYGHIDAGQEPLGRGLNEVAARVDTASTVVFLLVALVLLQRSGRATAIAIGLLTVPALVWVFVFQGAVFVVLPGGLLYIMGAIVVVGLLVTHWQGEQHKRIMAEHQPPVVNPAPNGNNGS